jgi:hypothetical protein
MIRFSCSCSCSHVPPCFICVDQIYVCVPYDITSRLTVSTMTKDPTKCILTKFRVMLGAGQMPLDSICLYLFAHKFLFLPKCLPAEFESPL